MRFHATATAVTISLLGSSFVPSAAHARNLGFSFAFGSRTPATPTTGKVHVLFPTDSQGRPRQLRGLDFEFPRGTRIDRSIAPRCEATDDQINRQGADACPSATQVGFGTATAYTGFGPPVDPFPAYAQTFNTAAGTVNIFTPRGSPAPALYRTRQRYVGLWVKDEFPPPPPGFPPPDGKSLPLEAQFILDKRVGRRSWLTTPRRCPSSRAWTVRIVLTFADGVRRVSMATTPCLRGRAR